MYKDNAETIIGNCDTALFLGGKEKTTLKDLSDTLGKETIKQTNHSVSNGNGPSFGQNCQKFGKDVLSCKRVKSATLQLQGSSFICGTDERTAVRGIYLPAQEQFVWACGVIRCEGTFFEKFFKKCSANAPIFLLYLEGCNLNVVAGGCAEPAQKGGQTRHKPYSANKFNQRKESKPYGPL
jgi:hypothetical protein